MNSQQQATQINQWLRLPTGLCFCVSFVFKRIAMDSGVQHCFRFRLTYDVQSLYVYLHSSHLHTTTTTTTTRCPIQLPSCHVLVFTVLSSSPLHPPSLRTCMRALHRNWISARKKNPNFDISVPTSRLQHLFNTRRWIRSNSAAFARINRHLAK